MNGAEKGAARLGFGQGPLIGRLGVVQRVQIIDERIPVRRLRAIGLHRWMPRSFVYPQISQIFTDFFCFHLICVICVICG